MLLLPFVVLYSLLSDGVGSYRTAGAYYVGEKKTGVCLDLYSSTYVSLLYYVLNWYNSVEDTRSLLLSENEVEGLRSTSRVLVLLY